MSSTYPASRSNTECPARARLEAIGPPPGPEPTTIYSNVLLSIDVNASTGVLTRKAKQAIITKDAMVGRFQFDDDRFPLKTLGTGFALIPSLARGDMHP
jgi:hypothetical protein